MKDRLFIHQDGKGKPFYVEESRHRGRKEKHWPSARKSRLSEGSLVDCKTGFYAIFIQWQIVMGGPAVCWAQLQPLLLPAEQYKLWHTSTGVLNRRRFYPSPPPRPGDTGQCLDILLSVTAELVLLTSGEWKRGVLQNTLQCVGPSSATIIWCFYNVGTSSRIASWGQLMENLEGQGQRNGPCLSQTRRPPTTKTRAVTTAANPSHCKWPLSTKEISPVASAILL